MRLYKEAEEARRNQTSLDSKNEKVF
jgi:hypothetical protein